MYVLYTAAVVLRIVVRGQYRRYYTYRTYYGYAWVPRHGPCTFMCVGRQAGVVQVAGTGGCITTLLRSTATMNVGPAASTVQCSVSAHMYPVQYGIMSMLQSPCMRTWAYTSGPPLRHFM